MENPHKFMKSDLHPEKIGIWWGNLRKKFVGLFFFERRINVRHYQEIIQDFITNLNVKDKFCRFQQDGAIAPTAAPTMDFLREFFDTRIILKNLWPPRSPDLLPCDFFWGYVKDKIFPHNLTSIKELKIKFKVICSIDVTTTNWIITFYCRACIIFTNVLSQVPWQIGNNLMLSQLTRVSQVTPFYSMD